MKSWMDWNIDKRGGEVEQMMTLDTGDDTRWSSLGLMVVFWGGDSILGQVSSILFSTQYTLYQV